MRMARCRDLYCLNHQSLVPACNIQIDQPGSAGQAGLAGLDPTQWRTKVGLLMILVTLPHNFRNIFYTTNIFSDLIQTFLNWPLITNNYSAGRDRRVPRNGHGHSKKIFRKIWSQWTPGNMQFVKICFHHFYEMLPMCRGLLFMYKTTYSMGGYSSKNSLFLLIFAVKRCLKILYVSSFFPPFLLERKGLKISSSKKVRIQGWLKLAQFLLIEIWGLPTLHSFISGITPSIFKILVPILVQISWFF